MKFNIIFLNVLLSFFVSTTTLYAADEIPETPQIHLKKTLSPKGYLEQIDSTRCFSIKKQQEIKESNRHYYTAPIKFFLEITIDPVLPSDMYPIEVTFQTDTPRTILLCMDGADLPFNQRLPEHKNLAASYCYYPQDTRLSRKLFYREEGPVIEEKWVNLFD